MALAIKALVLLFGLASYEALANQRVRSFDAFLAIWNRWDAPHYLDLARYGYQATGEIGLFIVFFPLFPLLTRLAAIPFGDYLVGAFVVSTLASVAAAVLFYRLFALDDARDLAQRAVWFLFIFPTSYFLHIGYTESLFLALVAGCVLAGRMHHWSLAGVLGLCAGLARLNGALLMPVLAVEALLQYRATRRWHWSWLWIGAVALGPALYLLLNYHVTGDPFRFVTLQREHWFQHDPVWPWVELRETARAITWREPNEAQTIGVQALHFALLGLAGTVATWLTLRPSYGVWMTANWLLFTTNTLVYSAPRYTLTLFPLFILFARLAQNRGWNTVITVWSLLLLGLFTSLFVQDRWAF